MKRVLALDPGAIRMGWAVLEIGPEYIDSGILGLSRIRDGEKIAFQVYKLQLEEYWAHMANVLFNKYRPSGLINEILPAQGSFTAQSTDSELAKVALTSIHTVAFQRGIEIQQIAANSVKKAMTGNGKATKVQVRNGVVELLPTLKPRVKDWTKADKMDEPDAIGVGLAGLGYRV